jgi:hypothetical protein
MNMARDLLQSRRLAGSIELFGDRNNCRRDAGVTVMQATAILVGERLQEKYRRWS